MDNWMLTWRRGCSGNVLSVSVSVKPPNNPKKDSETYIHLPHIDGTLPTGQAWLGLLQPQWTRQTSSCLYRDDIPMGKTKPPSDKSYGETQQCDVTPWEEAPRKLCDQGAETQMIKMHCKQGQQHMLSPELRPPKNVSIWGQRSEVSHRQSMEHLGGCDENKGVIPIGYGIIRGFT